MPSVDLSKRKTVMTTPPAAAPPKLKGKPLPVGKPVRLLDSEKRELVAMGWKEGDPVPANMAELVAEFKAAAAAAKQDAEDVPLPVDPSTPPVKLETRDIGTLTPAQQDEFRRKIMETMEAQHVPSAPEGRIPDVARKVMEAPVMVPTPAAKEPAPAPAAEPVADAGLRPEHPGNCPHCGWDLARTDIPEPDDDTKLSFFQTVILGDKPFEKEYDLLAGNLKLRFRTLTVREIDAIYAQVAVEQDRGEVKTQMDVLERLNRYRLALQLRSLTTPKKHCTLPEGLSKETNANAEDTYVGSGDEPVKDVCDYVLTSVLPNETLARTAQRTCNQFNRLVSRMEAMIDNADFWPKTATRL